MAGGAAKLGEQVAARLESVIRSNAWPAGHYLGHEEQLSRDFGTSRSVIREAIAIAEWNGVVESRRGREGGLYVRERALDPAIALLRNYLFLSGADLPSLLRARRLIEGRILELATERIEADDAAGLAGLLADPASPRDDRVHLSRLKQIVDRMSELADAPLLRLFGGALRHCYVDRVRTTTLDDGAYLRASRAVAKCRMLQIQAILDYDRGAVRDLQTRAMDIWEAFAAELSPARLSGAAIVDRLTATGNGALIYEFVQPAKKAEAVARAIAQMIANRSLDVGERLGTEAELLADFGVSRRVFREGVRILERFGIVEPGRGKLGGLMVGSPRRDMLIASLGGNVPALAETTVRDDGLLPMLLTDAVRALVAQDECRRDAFVRAVGAAQPPSASGLARLVAIHAPDALTGCLIEITLDCGRRSDEGRLDRRQLSALLNAIGSADRFAAPRMLRGLCPPAA